MYIISNIIGKISNIRWVNIDFCVDYHLATYFVNYPNLYSIVILCICHTLLWNIFDLTINMISGGFSTNWVSHLDYDYAFCELFVPRDNVEFGQTIFLSVRYKDFCLLFSPSDNELHFSLFGGGTFYLIVVFLAKLMSHLSNWKKSLNDELKITNKKYGCLTWNYNSDHLFISHFAVPLLASFDLSF